MADENNLNTSLRPLLVLNNFIGIYLTNGREVDTIRYQKWLKSIYSWLLLLLNIAAQVATLCFSFQVIFALGYIGRDKLNSITSQLSAMIDFTNYTFTNFTAHLIMLTVVRPRFAPLMQHLIRLENELEDQFFNKIRLISAFGVGSILLLVRNTIFKIKL